MAGRRARGGSRLRWRPGIVIALVILRWRRCLSAGQRGGADPRCSPRPRATGWHYGANGYDLGANDGIGGDLTHCQTRRYADEGARYVWDWCTSDPRALQNPDQTTRTAATYYDADQIIVTLPFTNAYSGNRICTPSTGTNSAVAKRSPSMTATATRQRAFQATSARALGSHSLSTSPPRARSPSGHQ